MVEARNAQASSVRGNGHWIGVMVQHILTYSVVCDSSKVAIIVAADHPVE
jgi:hypothetical protein